MKQEKKDALSQFHKQNIIKTAEKLFLEKGKKETTMDDIAKAADYSKSTIYVYFKSKDEIYNTIIFSSMSHLKEQMFKSVYSGKDFLERYYDICYSLAAFQEKYPLYFESILGEINVDTDSIKSHPILHDIYLIGEENNDIIRRFIQEGTQKGILQEDIKVPEIVFVFWSSISGIIRMAGQKSRYIEETMNISKSEFLQYSFETLLSSILKK